MELCNSCLKIRLGDNNTGDTLEEAIGGLMNAMAVSTTVAVSMLESIIPQAKKGGACNGCISFLQMIKDKIS